MSPDRPRLAVAIATYRRPDGLEDLLLSLAASEDAPPFDVVVVDNDPEGSAAVVLDALAPSLPFSLIRVHVAEPGIAAARNAALDAVRDHDHVCFVDDDETVDPTWLAELVALQESTGADGVTGPVVFDFDVPPPRWSLLGGFWVRPRPGHGASCRVAATNNLLLSVAALHDRGLRFDASLGLTGGSDMELTERLTSTGGTIVWCESAVVRERVPAPRCRARWIVRRAVRSGNTTALVQASLSREAGPFRRAGVTAVLVAGGVVRVLLGAVLVVSAPAVDRQVRGARGLRVLLRGLGVLGACLRRPVEEYARPQQG